MASLVCTFHTDPSFVKVTGETMRDRVCSIRDMGWGGTTNFVKTFECGLNYMKANNVKPEEAVEVFLCISDMQFDQAAGSTWGQTNYNYIHNLYEKSGYKMPEIWFWNVVGNTPDFPVLAHQPGVAMVS